MNDTGRKKFERVETNLNTRTRWRNIAASTAQCYNQMIEDVNKSIQSGEHAMNAILEVLDNTDKYPQLENRDVRTKLKELLLNYYKKQGINFSIRREVQHNER